MEAYAYFSSAIYREERPEWVGETLEHSKRYYDRIEDSAVKQTENMASDSELSYLSSYFRDKGVSILRDQGYLTDEYEFYVSAMWAQEFGCNSSNIMHVHGDSQISGFYFLDAPEGGSYPIFDDPRPGKKMADLLSAQSDEIKMATPQIHFNNVKAGTIMLFNSWLPHMITQNQSNDATRFIHFILSQRKRFI